MINFIIFSVENGKAVEKNLYYSFSQNILRK